MTLEDIIRMAREASGGTVWWPANSEVLERFAALAAAAEREAVIALCEEHWRNGGNAMECADSIRARGEK